MKIFNFFSYIFGTKNSENDDKNVIKKSHIFRNIIRILSGYLIGIPLIILIKPFDSWLISLIQCIFYFIFYNIMDFMLNSIFSIVNISYQQSTIIINKKEYRIRNATRTISGYFFGIPLIDIIKTLNPVLISLIQCVFFLIFFIFVDYILDIIKNKIKK